ncbi:hypothetical protein HELRODRAFT_64107 [Helobdella robusta]|uniref:GDP-fucose protein O-fucosyltransferase 2 n=1 Tax=Helobdella robusta TaxID=6412 RepID=T1FXP3_HELRO|nr:hypothetical protein HELRODRAFT_64107 [Helobdella robusta]ESO06363.1 hypothetical protein HELRODRAFT_64107 [Helobdella robusta]
MNRFLLYDVNPGEGFNLRRDVYLRMANLVKMLNKVQLWTLVLPAWNHLYHWRSDVNQTNIPWYTFFDIGSLNKHVPVIEFHDFVKVMDGRPIDDVIYFQHYKEGWGGKWVEKMDDRECNDNHPFYQLEDGLWHWYMPNITSVRFKCVSIQAEYSFLKDYLIHNLSNSWAVMFPRGEQVMHGEYSEWTARRSVRFSKDLVSIGDKFRSTMLDSDDFRDQTVMEDNWKKMKRKHGDALGGPYLAAHLRRRDFLYGHQDKLPSMKAAAQRINEILDDLHLKKVFVATDASGEELEGLKINIKPSVEVYRYQGDKNVLRKYGDGGVAIIDQWICAHARYFIGTTSSTFSFRIHEEREILGFRQETTYNAFCVDGNSACEQPSKWKIIYKK